MKVELPEYETAVDFPDDAKPEEITAVLDRDFPRKGADIGEAGYGDLPPSRRLEQWLRIRRTVEADREPTIFDKAVELAHRPIISPDPNAIVRVRGYKELEPVVEKVIGKRAATPYVLSAAQGAQEFVSGLSSPVNLGLMVGMGKLPAGIPHTAISIKFLSDMVGATAEEISQAISAYNEKRYTDIPLHIVKAILSAGFTAGIAKGLAGGKPAPEARKDIAARELSQELTRGEMAAPTERTAQPITEQVGPGAALAADKIIAEREAAGGKKVETGEVTESRATIDLQLKALREGTKPVVMLPGVKERPATLEADLEAVPTEAGLFVYKKGGPITPEDIQSAVANNKVGELLRHPIEKAEAIASGEPVIVVAKVGGKEAETVVATPETQKAAVEELKAKHPDATVEVNAEAVAKEPWQITKAEWIEETRKKLAPTNEELKAQGFSGQTTPKESAHYYTVKHALEKGKPIPAEVLADYPDLVKKATDQLYLRKINAPGEMIAESEARIAALEGKVAKQEPPPKEAEPVETAAKPESVGADYRGTHRPVTTEGGAARLHDLTSAFGEDIYGKNAIRYFGTGDAALDGRTVSILQSLRGAPDKEVTVYRAIPKDAIEKPLSNGDWVTVNKEYAKRHGESALNGDYKIVEQTVAAKDLTTNADSFHEQGYHPEAMGGKPELVGMGAAVPGELERSSKSPTAMKYKLIDEERQKRGLEPLVTGRKSLSDQATMDKAIAKLDTDPGYGDRLVADINAGRRTTIDDWENHVLLLKKIDLQVERARVARDTIQAYEDSKRFPNRLDESKALSLEGQAISDQLTAIEQASRTSGSYRGAALRSLRVLAYEDYSLAKMEMDTRVAKGGRQLTKDELAKLQEMQKRIEDTEKAYEDYKAKSGERTAQLEADLALNRIKLEASQQPTVEPHIKIIADRVKVYFDKRAEAALKRLSGKTFTLGPDVLADLADLGASKIISGSIEFGQWSAKMIEALGERVKPHLRVIFDASNKALDDAAARFAGGKETAKVKRAVRKTDAIDAREAAVKTITERVEAGKTDEIAGQVQKIARYFVEQGIRQRDPLIDAVHDVLKGIIPDLTRRDTMDAISGYGQFKQLRKDEISVQLRDLKGQMQQIAKLEDMQAGKPPSKTGLERRIPSAEESRLIKAVNDAKNKFQIPVDDPNTQLKSSLDTLKTRIKNRTAELEDKLARGDFKKTPKRIVEMDAEANRLHFEMSKAKAKYHEALMKDRLANRTLPQKVMAGLGETVNTFRAIMTGGEFSAVLRQGGFTAFSRPILTAKNLPDMFRAFRSERNQHAIDQAILARKNFPLYTQSKLDLAEHGQKLSQMEEAYMTRWGEKIPFIAGSQRAYTTFLNKLRADMFDVLHRTLARSGEVTMEEARAISNFVNVSTGRGNLGAKENALVALNTAFFAPRYVASRFQLLAGQPLYRGNARTRKLIAGEYARFLIGLGAVYALGKMAGAEVETDTRSSDFGKMKFGKTRLDPLAGLSQATVLLGRLSTGETKRLSGKIVPIRGQDVPFGSGNSADVLGRFLRTKLSPSFGTGVDVLAGEDVVGRPVTPQSVAGNLLVPITYNDIYQAMREQSIPAGVALGLLSIFGMGLQTYQEKKPKDRTSNTTAEPLEQAA